ncbi:MAG TPA: shikimate kinase [Acidobacteriaceae bacterium]|jgi:shikimate kinase|nr:shikimate kinase [Acidobacteriaceae bacterium]
MSAGPPGSTPLVSPPVIPLRRIVLTGFMGAGKSTVGRILAARLRWPFLDIDSLIAAEHGRTVAQIFADHGEEHFRRVEFEATARVLDPAHEYPQAVIALGGGAIETEAVRELLFLSDGSGSISVPATVTIFLAAPLPDLLARCHVGSTQSTESADETPARPLLTAAEPPEDRLARRLPHYRRAHLTVDTAGIPPVEVVERIVRWLRGTAFSGL